MAKEQPKKETEGRIAIRKEIRKKWITIEAKLIEMAHNVDLSVDFSQNPY